MRLSKYGFFIVVLLLVACTVSLAGSNPGPVGDFYLTLLKQNVPTTTGTIYSGPGQAHPGTVIGPVYINVLDVANQASIQQYMLCVDLLGTINWGPDYSWYANKAYGPPSSSVSMYTWNRVVYMANHYDSWFYGGASTVQKAAMQIAVWETLRDGANWNLDIYSDFGGFGLDGFSGADKAEVVNLAWLYHKEAYEATLLDTYAANQPFFLATRPDRQDMLFLIPNYPPPVPEVPTMVLGSAGLATIGVIRRKVSKG
jgi:hypothetical protein